MTDQQLTSLADAVMASRLEHEFMVGLARALGGLALAIAIIAVFAVGWLVWRLIRRRVELRGFWSRVWGR